MHFSTTLLQAIMGIIFFLGLTFIFSDNKKLINWKLVLSALFLQNVLFIVIRYVPFVNSGLSHFSSGIIGRKTVLTGCTVIGAYTENPSKFFFTGLSYYPSHSLENLFI